MNAIEMLEKVKTEGGAIALQRINENGDTSLHVKIRPIIIYPKRTFKNNRHKKRYYRLVRNIKKVYPYSIIIKNIFVETEFVLQNMENNKERRKYINKKEKELKRKFEGTIRNMTYSQGRILIKLVDRETQHTTYELVKHFKGGIAAFFWQGIAKIFETDLKYEYDPDGTDKWIEEIVSRIENGQL
ncbi:MAG: DUF4294 domain-containing protein [Bacteroidales bacterium]|nr:DUF4294 domain-containing protein [Bacteroidales bacterium]